MPVITHPSCLVLLRCTPLLLVVVMAVTAGAEQGHHEGADDHPHGHDSVHHLQRRAFHQPRHTGASPTLHRSLSVGAREFVGKHCCKVNHMTCVTDVFPWIFSRYIEVVGGAAGHRVDWSIFDRYFSFPAPLSFGDRTYPPLPGRGDQYSAPSS